MNEKNTLLMSVSFYLKNDLPLEKFIAKFEEETGEKITDALKLYVVSRALEIHFKSESELEPNFTQEELDSFPF